jgi:hypothetical protein
VIFLALLGVRVRGRQERIDFRFFQIGKRILSCALERNISDLPIPHQVFRTALADKVCKGVYG